MLKVIQQDLPGPAGSAEILFDFIWFFLIYLGFSWILIILLGLGLGDHDRDQVGH